MKACLVQLSKEHGFGELFLLLLLGSLADLGKGTSKYISSEKTSYSLYRKETTENSSASAGIFEAALLRLKKSN